MTLNNKMHKINKSENGQGFVASQLLSIWNKLAKTFNMTFPARKQ